MDFVLLVAPLLTMGDSPLRVCVSWLVQAARPVTSPALDSYGLLSPQADWLILARPEFNVMFSTTC
nr:hypothetical protein [Mycobacterium lepromatosis]